MRCPILCVLFVLTVSACDCDPIRSPGGTEPSDATLVDITVVADHWRSDSTGPDHAANPDIHIDAGLLDRVGDSSLADVSVILDRALPDRSMADLTAPDLLVDRGLPDADLADAGAPDTPTADQFMVDSAAFDHSSFDASAADGAAQDIGWDATVPGCLLAQGQELVDTSILVDGQDQATVTVTQAPGCNRSFLLQTTIALRDGQPDNPLTITEQTTWPSLQTHHQMFDALYALALQEVRENSVDSIHDAAFDNNNPLPCPSGGCFETGRLWNYVWTRDTAYAVHLALAALDPIRARNSLTFKLSQRREGGQTQIIQDTGTGGSYPISSDRVVWAMGAWQVLKYLQGTQRQEFFDLAYTAISNTIHHDRAVVYDSVDGLYRGEQSFLDWRGQTYPIWAASDPVHIGLSKSLSTNIGHLKILEIAAAMSEQNGMVTAQQQYAQWASALRTAIDQRFYISEVGLYSTYLSSFLNPAPVKRYDLLGNALAVLANVASENRAQQVVTAYPHLPKGPPVVWPQKQFTAIYHNRALWPFVTAYWLRAARQVGNDAAINHNTLSLVRGAALNLSNMENFEMESGSPLVDDGDYTGPVVNSQRQLWSVAGYISMVHDIVFGLQAEPTGIRFLPMITKKLRHTVFRNASDLVLNNFPYKGKSITVRVVLPEMDQHLQGSYGVDRVDLNGQEVGTDYLQVAQLEERNLLQITLAGTAAQAQQIHLVNDPPNYRHLFSPRTPRVNSVTSASGHLRVAFNNGGEAANEVTIAIYRDGQLQVADLPGDSESWSDPDTVGDGSPSHCYAVETTYIESGTVSYQSAPFCYWGNNRILSLYADSFAHTGGTASDNYGKFHYQQWGDDGHTLTTQSFTAATSGPHLLQLVAGNGAGPVSTGVTCAVKLLQLHREDNGQLVAAGQVMVPQIGDWSVWQDSSFVPATLAQGVTYRITIREDPFSINMSDFSHFALYTGGEGGTGGAFNRVNIAEVKVLSLQ